MQLDILTPEHRVFSGEVYGVQLPGVGGSFEILQNHAPIVAALGEGKMKVLKDRHSSVEMYKISGGFVETLNNKTTVLLESAEVSQ